MNYTKVLRWALIIGLCLVPFVAFIIADGTHSFGINMFFPYITGKNFAFRILVEVMLAAYVILAIREPKYRPRSSSLMWAFGGLVVWMAVATIFSVDPSKSFWSNFERMDGYITLLHMFALFVIASTVLTVEKWWEKFFQVSVAASVLQGIYAVMQVFGIFGLAPSSQSGARADTTFGNATYLAVFMLFNLFITLFLLYRERKSGIGMWIFYGVAILLQAAGLYYTETRGTLLGAVGGLMIAGIYIALFAKGSEWKRARKYSLYGLGAIVVLVVAFLFAKNTSFVQNSPTLQRFATISLVDRTTASRFTIWHEAWEGFKQSPKTVILGWGQENFNFVFNKYYEPSMYDQEQWFDRAHNQFIDWAIDGGLPAFLLYVSIFVLAAWIIFKSELDVPEQALMLGLLAGYAFNNLLVFDNLTSYFYFALIIAFVHGLSAKKPHGWMFMSRPLGDRAVAVAAPIVLVVLVWGGWYLNGAGIARAQVLIDALTTATPTGTERDPSQNLAAFQKALGYGPLGYQETVEQLFQFTSNTIAASTSISPDVKQQAFTETTAAGDAMLKQRPGDARLELFYGVFLDQFGQYAPALAHLNAGLLDSPAKQQMLFEIGTTYLAEGDTTDALPPLKKAYDEDSTYNEALVYYASGLYYNGQNAAADALLISRFGTVEYNDQILMQTFYATKQYARLAAIYAANVAKDPTDIQSAASEIILDYFATGNVQAAIAALNKLSAANPALSTQIQSFVSQIQAGTLKP